MITEFLVNMALGLWNTIIGWMPDWEMPAELADTDGMLATVINMGQAVGVFVDWAFVFTVGLGGLALWLLGLAWKGLRTLFSHVPFIGGSG